MDHHRTEVPGRRTLFNGLVTAATRSWRHGLQPSCGGGHTSNAMVFPTVSAAASPTCRTPVAPDVSTTAEEQRIRLQQQRHREHRLNILWYGGEDTHHQQQQQAPTILFESQNHRCQSTDDWEKRPLRQRRRKSRQQSRRGRNRRNKRPGLPTVPVLWAAVLLAAYATAMAATYHVYGATAGSGWVWLKSVAGHRGPLRWLGQLSPTLYYAVQASCAVAIGCFWSSSQRQHSRRLCCHVLLALFIAAICPSMPFAEVFGGGGVGTTATGNSTVHRRQQKQSDDHLPGDSDDNRRLAMYEGLWQVTFFVFVAYCLVLPAGTDDDESDDGNDETVLKKDKRNGGARNADEENHDVTTAVLLFSTLVSIGHTSLNAYTAYRWYFQQRYNRDNNSAAIQQFIANVVVLTCINLTGWLLRQSMVRDRAEIIGRGCHKRERNREQVRFALRRQTNKLNLLLTSLLPKRVFSEMKYDIVTDAARSRNNVTCNSNDEDYQNDPHLQRLRQELQLHTSPQLPKIYMKEYSDVSVVCANVTGFWENASDIAFHNETDSQQSRQLTELIDKLMVDLFNRLARRNGCVMTRLLGNRIFFVAGLPAEEHYGLDDDECNVTSRQLTDDVGHAKNAVQLGLDLIDTVNMVTHHVSRRRCSHKINLGIRVGVHSGKVTCGVLGFVSATDIHSDLGSRWQYEMWGHDVLVASNIESSGRPGWVHVTQATVDQIIKDRIAVPEGNHPVPKGVMRNKAIKYGLDPTNNMHDYTFKKGNDYNQMDTYFVVPNTTKCSNSEMNGNPPNTRVDTHDNDGIDNYYGENFESLIRQSVDRQIQLEELRRQYSIDFTSKIETASTPLPPSTTTAASSETPMIPAAPGTTMKMIMNRHRRSRYEQEPLQAVATKLNITTSMKHHNRWDEDVFGDYDNDDHDKIKRKSDDDDLFRLAKSQLLLLCVIIALFVVNVTTMPWTILLGITFITPFVVTAGGLIYVMALLIDWIPRPRFCSTAYTTAIIADDEEYYQHYDSDSYDSDSTCTSTPSSSGCLRRLFICDRPRNYSLFAWLSKPFRWGTNTTMMNRSPPDDCNSQQRCTAKWYHCCRRGHYGWFTWCLDNDETPSWISSDDSDIESRLGFRNENAIIMAATAGILPPQQLQNRLHHPQTITVKNSHNTGRLHQRHSQLRRKYQDEERHTWFFWLAACSEMFVILLVCLLALLNAFTCEPVAMTATNAVYSQLHTINNNSGGFNTTRLQQLRSPLVCPWPQYVVLTCCLACVSIAIAFPIYYGSLPTLRWKITILFTMTCVFAVAFVHFTHKHVFIAASVSSYTPTCCMEVDNIHNHQTINTTIRNIDHHLAVNSTIHHDLYQEDQQQSKIQDKEQQRAAGLDTAITTVYVIIFAAAMLAYFTYAHHLQKRRAYHKVNINRDVRRLDVLRTAHRRTLRAVMPDHVAHMLRSSCISNANDADSLCEETQRKQNNVSTDTRLLPVTITQDHQGREQIPSHPRSPFYHCSYQNVVVMFATIVKQDIPLVTPTLDNNANDGNQQLSIFLDTFIEFDRLLDDQKFRGLVDKIKMIGTETYMAAVGLQYPHKPDHQLLMLLNEIKQRNKESCHNSDRDKKNNIDSCNGSGVSVVNNLENVFELHNMISANYVIFALDFIRDMRRALHRRQAAVVTPVGYSHNSQPTQFILQVGVNVGPVVAGLIGCNNRLWKRPQFDIWGNTVNMAEQMDLTGIPGSTHVTHRVVDVLNSIKDPVYAFDELTNTKDNRSTYIVRENFHRDEYHRLVQQQFNSYQQSQPLYRQIDKIHKNLEPDRHQQHQQQHQQQQQQCKRPAVVRSPQNAHRTMTQQLDRDQPPLNAVPVVTVHPQHSYYNAMVQQELRQKHPTPLKTPPQKTPPPPPPRSPPSVNVRRTPLINYPLSQHQHGGEGDQRADHGQRSRGVQQNENRQHNRRTSDATTTTTVVTYARPLQKQAQQQQQQLQQSNNSRHSPNSCSAPAPRVLGPIFDGQPPKQQQTSAHRVPPPSTVAVAKPAYSANRTADGTAATHQNRQQQQQQQPQQQQQQRKPCRPTVLDLVNTTAVSSKRFDADRPLPAPPRSSDTVAGRQRHHNDPRRRRRQQQNQPPATAGRREQQQVRPTVGNDRCQAWPSTSSFRSPVSVDSLASVSSLSSSGSTDAGNTTTSNNNYNTTTTASSSSSSSCSSDDSFGRTEDDVDDRADTEDLDTAASSAAVSPVHRRYHQHRQQQHHLLLRQWSPSTTTANSSPVRRSSSFRSPLSTAAVASSSSLRSPPAAGHPVAGFGGTQSLNRRRLRPVNVTAAAGAVGSGSGRRRRRRQQQQQQQNNATSAGPSTPPSAVVPDADVSAVAAERYDDSPPSSAHWKKLLQQQQQQQLQRRQATGKDPGTAGGGAVASPDFTDEIRRILLLDHHRGNVRQQQQQTIDDGAESHDDFNVGKRGVADDVIKPPSCSSEPQQHRAVTDSTTGRNADNEKSEKNRRNENDGNDDTDAAAATTAVPVNMSSAAASSSFEERERQMTEQVERQQAEVRRILQAHKNNVVAVVRGTSGTAAAGTVEAILHGRRRLRVAAAESSEWSDDDDDDESVEPSSLLDDGRRVSRRAGGGSADDDGGGSVLTVDTVGDGYTTDTAGDGYTTAGYTTDDAAADRETDATAYVTDTDLPVARARRLDDNLSTMNDTGLTDAEAALSDVNSLIDFNDCNDRNRYGSRRQSSLSGSSACQYASDSFCEDDDDYNDDDDDDDDDDELIFQGYDRYNADNEKLEFRDDQDDNGRRYDFRRLLQQHQRQLSPSQQQQPPPSDGPGANNNSRSHARQEPEPQQSTSSQDNACDAKTGKNQRHVKCDSTAATTCMKTTTATNTSPIADNASNDTTLTATTMTAAKNIETDQSPSSPTVKIKDNSNIP